MLDPEEPHGIVADTIWPAARLAATLAHLSAGTGLCGIRVGDVGDLRGLLDVFFDVGILVDVGPREDDRGVEVEHVAAFLLFDRLGHLHDRCHRLLARSVGHAVSLRAADRPNEPGNDHDQEQVARKTGEPALAEERIAAARADVFDDPVAGGGVIGGTPAPKQRERRGPPAHHVADQRHHEWQEGGRGETPPECEERDRILREFVDRELVLANHADRPSDEQQVGRHGHVGGDETESHDAQGEPPRQEGRQPTDRRHGRGTGQDQRHPGEKKAHAIGLERADEVRLSGQDRSERRRQPPGNERPNRGERAERRGKCDACQQWGGGFQGVVSRRDSNRRSGGHGRARGHCGFVSSMLSPRSSGALGISPGLATSVVAFSTAVFSASGFAGAAAVASAAGVAAAVA